MRKIEKKDDNTLFNFHLISREISNTCIFSSLNRSFYIDHLIAFVSPFSSSCGQRRTGHCGNVAIAARIFFRECVAFFSKNAWHFKDIFREIEAF
jgi:hypothetical protein